MPRRRIPALFSLALSLLCLLGGPLSTASASAADKPKAAHAPRVHSTFLGGTRKEPYSQEGDPDGAQAGETTLPVRPLVVDGRVRDWTTGEAHDITERSFTVRRAIRINDSLPGDTREHWVWQRGPWVLVDRTTGHVAVVKLPDFHPGISQVVWFRDYAAYCGLRSNEKSLYAVVEQLSARKPAVMQKLAAWHPNEAASAAACLAPVWQREPMQVTFQANGATPVAVPLEPASAALVEPGDDVPAPQP